jgi:hypothetical protein
MVKGKNSIFAGTFKQRKNKENSTTFLLFSVGRIVETVICKQTTTTTTIVTWCHFGNMSSRTACSCSVAVFFASLQRKDSLSVFGEENSRRQRQNQ